MSPIQKFFTRIFPASWAASMETDSRLWMAHCSCGHARSIWDLGGIRWKAYGNSKTLISCPACGKVTWHTIRKDGP